MPSDPSTWIATNMTLLPDVPAVHGPFVLRLSRHLSRLLLKGLGSYRRLGAVLPLFTQLPRETVWKILRGLSMRPLGYESGAPEALFRRFVLPNEPR